MAFSKHLAGWGIGIVLVLAALAGVAFRTHAQPQVAKSDRDELLAATTRDDRKKIEDLAQKIAKDEGAKSIPFFIGLIDADNSYDTVYGIGYFHLRHLTEVRFSYLHDGPWWRRWWSANRQPFPEEVRSLEVPVFEKTAHGRRYIPFPEKCETLAGKLELAGNLLSGVEPQHADWHNSRLLLVDVAEQIAEHDNPTAIPYLIGLMDADNSPDTIWAIGGSALRPLTGARNSPLHDGAWWRRWWAENRQEFPPEAQAIAIPDIPKTKFGRTYTPYPADSDTLQGKLKIAATLLAELRAQPNRQPPADGLGWLPYSRITCEIAEHHDPHAVPYLIGLIEADNTEAATYGVGYYGLGLGRPPLTDVEFDEAHDGRWWLKWWQQNKAKYPADVQSIEIPDYRQPLVFAWKEPTKEEREQAKAAVDKAAIEAALADVADISAQDLTVSDNKRMRYFLIGPRASAVTREDDFKLVVVLPGGDGSADFHPFIRRLFKCAMNETYLVAQPVAVKWSPQQKITWPTKDDPFKKQQFTTEEFVEAVIQDVSARHAIDKRFVFTLSWSSGGPAAYAIALCEKTRVTGSYVAMSVFRPEWHPHIERAKGHAFLIDHSPQDKVCKFEFAEKAQRELASAGGQVRLVTYEGGHGWHGNIYGRVAEGLKWLVEKTEKNGQ
ncbi:MAG TPA: hypothetical protein VGZ26_03220 [Pirellulales bacterium]|nr:hypothetical protein [Pirellulales bacterium]